jgi:hypothetical protein
MKPFESLASVLCLCAAGPVMAQCYTVYDASNRVVYHAAQSPVDMSRPLSETVPQAFPGGHMVFDNFSTCNELRPLTPVVSAPPLSEPDTARMGAGPARKPERVITELKDPPLRVIREGDRLTIEQIDPPH